MIRMMCSASRMKIGMWLRQKVYPMFIRYRAEIPDKALYYFTLRHVGLLGVSNQNTLIRVFKAFSKFFFQKTNDLIIMCG